MMNSRTFIHSRIFNAALLGGLAAGAIDIGAASLITGKTPFLVLKVIAGGLIGRAALKGGAMTALLGAGLQEAMSLAIAAAFVGASLALPTLRKQWIAAGMTYGVGVFAVMNYVVLPLSALKLTPHFSAAAFTQNLAAMVLFGLIVSASARLLLGEDDQATQAEPRGQAEADDFRPSMAARS
ncbi:MAG: hypothetical protein WA840_12330 [Caulobacteraceae bacterium]